MDDYKKNISIAVLPEKVYAAITTVEGLKSWWTNLTEQDGNHLIFKFDNNTYVVMNIERNIENKEVVWRAIEQYFTFDFSSPDSSDRTNEWVGTLVRFNLTANPNGQTVLNFHHEGLTPKLSCYNDCQKGWDYFLESLKKYCETGNGTPFRSPVG